MAVASFSFDALNQLAWLDTVVEARGAGFLCQLHAERLTPPKGWSLLDRRSPEPKLFVAPAVTADPPAAPKAERAAATKRKRTPRARHPKNASTQEAPPAAVETPSVGAVTTPEGEVELPFDDPPPMPTVWSPRNLPELDEDLDDRTPMLARAFESLRQHEERRPETSPGA